MRNNRITYKQALEKISPGDNVYMIQNGEVIETKVLAVKGAKLKTEDADLYYSDHREKWFIEEVFARIAAKERSAT